MKPKLTVIGITSATIDTVFDGWEYTYIIKDLLSYFDVDLKLIDKNFNLFYDNALIIYSCDETNVPSDLMNYFSEYKKRGIDFNLFHLSNERLNHNTTYYELAKNVFRNYFDPRIKLNNVLTLPLGYKNGFYNPNNTVNLIEDKIYDSCFIGQLKNDRYEVVTQVNNLNHKFVHITQSWNCPNSIPSKEVFEIYQKTLVIPCPMGNVNQDSFRICEALESVSIPIVRLYANYDYFRDIFGNHPIPLISRWDELPSVIKKIKETGNKTILEINDWYQNFKEETRLKIFDKLNTHTYEDFNKIPNKGQEA